jgi:hypothetical protein
VAATMAGLSCVASRQMEIVGSDDITLTTEEEEKIDSSVLYI